MHKATRQEIQEEALGRALGGQSLSNWPAILAGFSAKGIPESDIRPRENVFTYHAWRALGRQVRRGEHGVKVVTFITTEHGAAAPADDAGGDTATPEVLSHNIYGVMAGYIASAKADGASRTLRRKKVGPEAAASVRFSATVRGGMREKC